MIAGRGACSCPTCGAVCKGKFGGCAGVWALGPRRDLALRSQAAMTTGGGPVASGNGSSHHHGQNGHTADAGNGQSQGDARLTAGPVGAQLQDISDRLAALNGIIEKGSQEHAADDAWKQNLAVMQELHRSIGELPQAVAVALGDALGRQHRMVVNDVRSLLREFLAELNGSHSAGAGTS